MPNMTRREILAGAAASFSILVATSGARADAPAPFSTDELVDSGHKFFGAISRGLAQVVEEAVRRWGQPNGYILGQEASAAFVGGLRYGEGKMYTRNAGDQRVQGVVLAFTDIDAGLMPRAALPNQNSPGIDQLPAKALYAQPLPV